ncbi:MAG: hypothetical protein WC979_01835 [Candidatus Pacearchaeota archaeon]|jgi:hypothetical protein|nr:hypothetical protein [Clostridia bacterium]
MIRRIPTIEDFALNESATLFGDMDVYINRFNKAPGFNQGEVVPRCAGTPDEFREIDTKGNWKTDGWNYTSIRLYTTEAYKNGKEVVDVLTNLVIAPNKKEWTPSKIIKNKQYTDTTVVCFEHPALGFIFFRVWDYTTGKSRGFGEYKDTKFQVQGFFMNGTSSWGKIDAWPQLKVMADDLADACKHEPKALIAVADYIKSRYIPNNMY